MVYMQFPFEIFHLIKNPDYGKEVFLDELPEPPRILYDYLICDWATLGRPSPPTWEEYRQEKIRQYYELLKKYRSTHSLLKMFYANSLQDVIDFYNENKDTLIRFIDTELNEHFNIIV